MNKTLKLVAVGALVISLSTGGIVTANTGTPNVQNLSLEQGIDLALKQNPKVELAQIALTSAETTFNLAKYKADGIRSEKVQSYLEGRTKWVDLRQSEAGITLKKAESQLTEKTVKLDVEKCYYDVLKAEQLLKIKRASLQRTKDQMKISEANVKAGTMAKGDLIGIEALLAKTEAEVTAAENQYQIALLNFNKSIGNDLDAKVKLTTKFVFEKAKDIDYNASLKDALDNNLSILSVKENLAVKEKDLEVAEKFFSSGVATYDQAQLARKEAEVKVKQQIQDTSLAVKQSYLNMLATEKMIGAYTKNADKERENLRIILLKYRAGLVTNLDVSDANLRLEEAEQKVTETMYQYNLAKASFKYGIFQTGTASGASSLQG